MQSAQSLLAILAMGDAIPSASVSPAWGGMYRVVETVSVFRCEQPCDGAGRAVLRYGAFVPAATTPKSPHEWFQVIPSLSWRLWDSPHLVGTMDGRVGLYQLGQRGLQPALSRFALVLPCNVPMPALCPLDSFFGPVRVPAMTVSMVNPLVAQEDADKEEVEENVQADGPLARLFAWNRDWVRLGFALQSCVEEKGTRCLPKSCVSFLRRTPETLAASLPFVCRDFLECVFAVPSSPCAELCVLQQYCWAVGVRVQHGAGVGVGVGAGTAAAADGFQERFPWLRP